MINYKEIKKENRKRINEYSLNPTRGQVSFYPAFIQIEQTNRCNAECIMCNHFYLGNRGSADLPMSVIEKIEPILPYCETVILNGDGEPFLCSSIEENIKRFYKYGVKIGTNTNLCFIPDSLWQYFSDIFEFLNISCDGVQAETFEMIRYGLKWDVFLKNLGRLKESAPMLKKNFDCVVMKQNVKELPDIVKLAANYGINSVRFRRLGVNPCIGNDTDRVEYFYDSLRASLDEAHRIGEKTGIEVVSPLYKEAVAALILPDRDEMLEEINIRKKDASLKMQHASLEDDYYSQTVTDDDWNSDTVFTVKMCQWAIERCYIDIQGNVTTCCFNMKKNMGSLNHQTFDSIWNGRAYTEFRILMTEHKLPGFCAECNWIKEARF